MNSFPRGHVIDLKRSSEILHRFSGSVALSHVSHLGSREFPIPLAVLGNHIVSVSLLISEKEMSRIDAILAVTARAVMANVHSSGNGASVQFPREAMGQDKTGALRSLTEDAITLRLSANPDPAGVCLPDSLPEPLFNRMADTGAAAEDGIAELNPAGVDEEQPSAGRASLFYFRGRRAPLSGIMGMHRDLLCRVAAPRTVHSSCGAFSMLMLAKQASETFACGG